jgi:hypothetical protein
MNKGGMMAERIFEIEHEPGKGFVVRINTGEIPLFSEAVQSHLRTAHKERLLALRSLIDAAIEQAEKPRKKETKRKNIKVE